uniref:hypothetical protein n=1 Tax=Paracoccus jeotgali TaxID=2065379 RepID=UPI0021F2C5A7|nr:hypothetical protein [Paracoccus jeotgali]
MPPYTWLMNGRPAAIASPLTEARLPGMAGMSEISVTDALGRTQRVRLRMTRPLGG